MKGGLVVIFPEHINRVKAAILKFQQEVTDPKAMILPTYNTVAHIVRVPALFSAGCILSLTQRY